MHALGLHSAWRQSFRRCTINPTVALSDNSTPALQDSTQNQKKK